ncbi:hypothetical protein M9Y10_036274 [Tritrichomonas musculus]|uniref:Serine/threonine-protein phosphatase n=1 Tax=Tritrichomonas musculus TaxID=1915356 RepID=A0ABR2GUY1_9EUKA
MDTHEQLLDTLKKLLQAKKRKPGTLVRVTQQMLVMICHIAKETFLKDMPLVKIDPPVLVVGDIHGEFYNLLRIFDQNGKPPDHQYLFLGDYVDRGNQSIETVTLLFIYKILYPEHIFLLRGNHESPEVNENYGFKSECASRYSPRLWNVFNDTFSVLPIAAIIGSKIFATHAGISPKIEKLDFFDSMERTVSNIAGSGPIEDLVWSDPDSSIDDWKDNPRGNSYLFGPSQIHKFLDDNDLEVLVRAHQNVPGGFEFPFEPDRCVVTIYSIPTPGDPVGSDGAVLQIDKEFSCSFSTIKPLERRSSLTL